MATISNVNNAYNISSSKTHKKLSFEVGEKFSARIINMDGETSEAILKLLDGWQFSAQIKDAMDFTPNKLIRFEVEGFDSGKILLKVLNEAEEKDTQSLVDILENQGVKVKDEDYNILEKMIKYNMPLTKENISKMKTLIEFQDKINTLANEEDKFIEKYLNNKNINLDSKEGQNIKNILKGFFNELKKLNTDEIFTLIQNNIELTEENIKSFNNINKEFMHIYKDIINEDSMLENIHDIDNSKEVQDNVKISNSENLNHTNEQETSDSLNKNNNAHNSKTYSSDNGIMDGKEILRRLLEVEVENNNSDEKQTIQESTKHNNESTEKSINDNLKNKNIDLDNEKSQKLTQNNEEKIMLNDDGIQENTDKDIRLVKDTKGNSLLETSEKVKEELNNKINDMKQLIKHVLEENNDAKSSMLDKIVQNLHAKMNDFKVFNSLSNQYYYLDVPVNFNEKEYPCKLIIKDDRKNGKKIDSTNVKFAVCVKTVNMGVVDAYINVMNSNINVNIKCEENWMKLLKLNKDNIINKLSSLGYMVGISVDKKQQEMNLVECNNFFEDSDFARINFKV